MIYLDNSATTRQYDEVNELMYKMAQEEFGNPSSLHNLGFNASTTLKESRKTIEAFLGCRKNNGQIIFTSSGTESDNMALHSIARKYRKRGKRIITTKIEHPAILETCRRLSEDGLEIIYLDVNSDGVIDISDLRNALSTDTILVSIMTVNNETGAIQPVNEASRIIRSYNIENDSNIIFHTDAVQAIGKIRFEEHDFDLISASGHKFHGPKGTGFLYMNKNIKLPAFITGGGQEDGYRSSTENTLGIAGMACALEMSYSNFESKMSQMASLNEYLHKRLTTELSEVNLNGPSMIGWSLNDAGMRCPSVINLTFEKTRGEVLLHTLEQDGIYVSTGSACASHKTGDSHVLLAMGLNHKQIEGALRLSFSEFNTMEEMDYVVEKLVAAVKRFRKLGSFR